MDNQDNSNQQQDTREGLVLALLCLEIVDHPEHKESIEAILKFYENGGALPTADIMEGRELKRLRRQMVDRPDDKENIEAILKFYENGGAFPIHNIVVWAYRPGPHVGRGTLEEWRDDAKANGYRGQPFIHRYMYLTIYRDDWDTLNVNRMTPKYETVTMASDVEVQMETFIGEIRTVKFDAGNEMTTLTGWLRESFVIRDPGPEKWWYLSSQCRGPETGPSGSSAPKRRELSPTSENGFCCDVDYIMDHHAPPNI
ncbi:hypothetical protein B0T26DRAFT_678695 [Lasiosphaeria miniovina]|uniref:Uncharacterized protein n=1 Tax=Lasiosphaeria miniovina TaxID=1954250 RepID=A0AA40DRF6_9PEZI|nr:uncharacterized protein B0T26DRAFT_678695 [Lasiosphaeria miniovina]KAK0709248.1 hypothetical protein B0T26DRAFT_678695 [Lasiosphaeria miniovina]